MEKKLSEKQKEYYNERVLFFKSLSVAVPTGIIHERALEMSDAEIDEWLRPGIISITVKTEANGKVLNK